MHGLTGKELKMTSSTQSHKPKRQRLTPKQRRFLHLVYDRNLPIIQVLCDLRIRVLTFERWLTKPVFIERLRMYITQYYIQARLEMARSAPSAIEGLTRAGRESQTHDEMRKACKDLLQFHAQYTKIAADAAQKGRQMDNFGAFWAHLGASLAQNGAPLEPLSTANNSQKPALQPKNEEYTKNQA